MESGLLSTEESQVIQDPSNSDFVHVALQILNKVSDSDVQFCLLTYIEEHEIHCENDLEIISKLFKQSTDELLLLQAAKTLVTIAVSSKNLPEKCKKELYEWIFLGISSENPLSPLLLLQYLLQVFPRDFATFQLFGLLVKILKENRNTQIQYQIIFCLWIISFEADLIEELQLYEQVPLLVEIAKTAIKEKIVRLCVAIWKNLYVKSRNSSLAVLIGSKVLNFLDVLATRNISDEEFNADLTFLREDLLLVYQSFNSFDQYSSEVKSGLLEWTPPHKSDLFWQENCHKLEEKDFDLLKDLTKIISTSSDPEVLSIASSDFAQYIKHRGPLSRPILEKLGSKQQLMNLMSHSDPEVRYQALTAVQSLLSTLFKSH